MKRLIALDMLRGYALVCIMLDHMPVSPLRGLTLANFSIFDAAELFVLLSGFLVGLVWLSVETRQGRRAAQWRFARRAFQVWRALVAGGIIMALLSALLLALNLPHTAIWNAYAEWIIEKPLGYLGVLATMWLQPNLLDVLAVYVVLLASAPLLVPVLLRTPLSFAAGSLLLWWFAPVLNPLIPNHNTGGLLFNPFGWQMLFYSGVAMGLFRARLMPVLMPHARLLTVLAAIMFSFGVTIIIAMRIGEPALPLRQALTLIYGEINKWPLDGTRYLAIMAASWLVAVPLAGAMARLADTGPGRALQTIGRGGLWSFIICVLLSVLGDALQMTPPGQSIGQRLVIDLWVMAVLWWMSWWWLTHLAPRWNAGDWIPFGNKG
ncbi:MAG: OpgC domain-containing protein [Paracoccus sp. (in: a-proteobacteria)]|uniref:OpgC domain-containing protein n=1 Tax=Paracoccus sp. TaxID=267 RepID=UPI0026DEEE0C|nr:OpgC domain-containing protein [Paracoccus sp. (in: a-proteobacteria)]MDO5612891.1 OpgC domain-containing protein [Paracoccus sp. (in: a-proteobacteria)]